MQRILIFLTAVLSAKIGFSFTVDEIYDHWGVMDTIAGTAFITGKSVNGWEEDMEGGSALDAELSRPHMAMADVFGNTYIADKDAHAVRMVKPDGTIHTIAGINIPGNGDDDGDATSIALDAPNGLFTFPDGTTYILDLNNDKIRKWTPDGRLTTLFHDDTGISIGRGLWVSPDESLVFYSSASQVKMWTPEEGVEVYAEGFLGLGNIAVDPSDGRLVATDRVGHQVYKVFDDGELELIAGSGEEKGGRSGDDAIDVGLKEVRGIAFNSDGTYFLATHDGGQIWFVDGNDRIHLVIDGDDEHETHAGDGELISTPGRKISEPRAITIAPNNDLLITEHDGGYIRRVEWIGPAVFPDGDLNYDGTLDVVDIDMLIRAIQIGEEADRFDVDQNGAVDSSDRTFWIEELRNTYLGDANLDGEFNTTDLVEIFQAGQYEDDIPNNSTWATGDWKWRRRIHHG